MHNRPSRRPRQVHNLPSQWIGARKGWKLSFLTLAQALVSLPAESHKTSIHVIGSTGSGKSVLLHHLIAQMLGRGEAIVVLDARGDMALATIELAWRAGIDPQKVKLFDPHSKKILGYNPLYSKKEEASSSALHVLDAIAAQNDLGVQTSEFLRMALLLCCEAKGNLTMLEGLFYDARVRQTLLSKAKSENVRAFWTRFDSLPDRTKLPIASAVLNKISILFATEPLRRMFNHPNPVDLSAQLETRGSVTAINLAVSEQGSAGWMVGSMFLASICRNMFLRSSQPESKRIKTVLVVDEFENFGMREFESILVEGRKYATTLLLAHQSLVQLSSKMRTLILGSVGVKFAFRTSYHDAEILNRDLTGNSRTFDLPNLRVGEAVLWLRGEAPFEIEINAPLIKDAGQLSPGAEAYLKQVQSFYPPENQETQPDENFSEDVFTDQPETSLEDWL